jgi:hypothetical protein
MEIEHDKKILSISVMAHPKREAFFPYLKEKLGDVPFSIDHKSAGVWPNAKKAWSLYNPEALFHVVIQDDAIVCEDFHNRAEREIVKAFKNLKGGLDFAVSFYFGNRGTLKGIAQEGKEQGFAIMGRTPWAVAICLPTNVIPEMLQFCDSLPMPQDDVRIGKFLRSQGMKVYFPLPSLIDHRTGEESLVGDEGKFRKAFAFIDNEKI